MPIVSINILTKNRAELLHKALESVSLQTFLDYEIIVINDGSTDNTPQILENWKHLNLKVINHQNSIGITKSRQEALENSLGKYIAILDDDDSWTDKNKLFKQVEFLNQHTDYVLVGGGMVINSSVLKLRPKTDKHIRRSMLIRNNFFTSTVMFNKESAVKAGGFISTDTDLAEDYDLWLRLGKIGKMYNFPEVFVNYHQSSYNKQKFKQFLKKQLLLVGREKNNYPLSWLAKLILNLRLLLK